MTKNDKKEYLNSCLDIALVFTDEAHYNCLKFKCIHNKYIITGSYPDWMEPVIFVDGVFSVIGQNAFKGNTTLKKIVLGYGVTQIMESAFEGCANLESVIARNTLKDIGKNAFKGCVNLKEVKLGSSVEVVRSSAFENCSSLVHIDLGRNIVKLQDRIFKDCTSLKKVRAQGRYLWYYPFAFLQGCTSLEKVIVPDYVTKIEDNCFDGCISLREVEVPSSVDHLGSYAFKDCNNIDRFVIRNLDIGDNWQILVGCSNQSVGELTWICKARNKSMWLMEKAKK